MAEKTTSSQIDATGPKTSYINEVVIELKKTTWPTYQEGIKQTGVVLLVITIFTMFIFVIDQILGRLWMLITPAAH